MLKITRRRLGAALAAAGVVWSAAGHAQRYPEKPITIVVAYPPGSDTDVMARLYAEKLAPRAGQPVLVVNRAGASGMLGSSHVAHAAPDGHTLLFAPSTFATAPLVLKQAGAAGYDPVADFKPVIQMTTSSLLLVAHPGSGFRKLGDIVDASRRGQRISYGTSGSGSPMHIVGEWLNRSAGTALQHIPYKGVAPSVTDVVAGHIPIALVTIGPVRQYAYPDVRLRAWNAFFAPAGTPAPGVAWLNDKLGQVLALPDVVEALAALSAVPAGGSPGKLGAQVAADYRQLGRLIDELKIQAD
ncbi:MAG: hypothetical protein ABT00_23725 [Bordetella sp. SCN 68-11]|nr:MAG: hypothetical protein ABT00_23725 [Bordetella sp. SCN 68-11]